MPHCDVRVKRTSNQGVEAPANIFRGVASSGRRPSAHPGGLLNWRLVGGAHLRSEFSDVTSSCGGKGVIRYAW
jgi:hypothetical protein